MSLIDEALKRARQEAALQDAAQREAQFRRVPVFTPPPPSRSRSGLVMAGAGICVGLALALGLAFAAGWLPAGRSAGEAAAPVGEELRAAATAAEAPAPQIVEEAPADEPVAPVDRTDPTDRTDPSDPIEAPPPVPAPAPTPAAVEPQPAPAPVAEPAAEEAPPVEEAPAPETVEVEPAAPAAPLSYVRQVPVPGGGTLELSGIAFSAERPVALINGKPWVPGEVVQGYTIIAVEPGRVQLDGHGQKVFVSLK